MSKLTRKTGLRRLGGLQLIVLTAILAIPQIARSAADSQPDAVLRLVSADGKSRMLRQDEIASMRHQTVEVIGEKGSSASYAGVPVESLLELAGAPFGVKLRGPQMRLYVLVEGSDGYAAAFALAEFDPGFTNQTILVADRCDGRPLSSFEGPLRIIVPGEKRRARWVRKVIEIEVRRAN